MSTLDRIKGRKMSMSAPTVVEYGRMRFLITDQPDERQLRSYVDLLKEYHVAHVARACEPTYKEADIAPIRVHEFAFDDGSAPQPDVIKRWLDLCESCFINKQSSEYLSDGEKIAVHCVAGLGRAPVLVVIALIEDGMEPLQAAQFVRSKRKGALNTTQLHWVGQYVRTRDKKWNRMSNPSTCICM
jgi:protein tyrosine phosphatase type 4A